MKQNALIIFTRNPELGKCKTRLAKTIGDKKALEVYKYLLVHTAEVCSKIDADKYVFYSETISIDDIWDDSIFNKKLQKGESLGDKMANAFSELLDMGYIKVVIVGSDLLDLRSHHIDNSFNALQDNEVVIGPAEDGGYYLLGLNKLIRAIFENKEWGTDSVLKDTLKDLNPYKVNLLEKLNDIDTFDDLLASDYYKGSKKLQNLVSKIHD